MGLSSEARRRTQARALEQAEQLARTLADVGAASTLEDALRALVRGALALLRGERGLARLFHLSSPRRARHDVTVAVEAYADGRLEVRWNPPGRLQPGNFGYQLREGGSPVLVDDLWALDPQRYPAYHAMRGRGLRSSVNVPIDAGGRRIGSLHVDHSQPGFFHPDDLAAASALAAQAGAAIERARMTEARLETQRRFDAQAQELAARNAEAAALRELDRIKNEFIRSISHELRTPLTVVHGYAQQLHARAGSLDPPTIQRLAATLLASSTRLTRLVTDLLDFTRIERGELSLQPEHVDVAELLHALVGEFRQEPGGERLVCQVHGHLVALADHEKMRQAVANLVDNALKYAPTRPIVVRAFALSDRPGRSGRSGRPATQSTTPRPTFPGPRIPASATIRIEVEDHGPGIPVRERGRLWERFYRGAAVAGLNVVPGSGIGLAVTKALVEVQSGRVGLDTPAHGGCLFWIEVPSALADESDGPVAATGT